MIVKVLDDPRPHWECVGPFATIWICLFPSCWATF